jgi:hypothetical protein
VSTPNSTPALVAQLAERDQLDAFDRELEALAQCPDCWGFCLARSTIVADLRHVTLWTWHSKGCPNKRGNLGPLDLT